MINTKKLNNTIQDLEGQVINIKKISNLINKIEESSEQLVSSKESYLKVTDDIKNIEIELSNLIYEFNNYIKKHENSLENITSGLSKEIKLIGEKNNDYHGQVLSNISDITLGLNDARNILKSRITDLVLRLDDIDSSLNLKLDSNHKLFKEYLKLELNKNVNSIGETVLESEDVIMDRFDKSITEFKIELENYLNDNISSLKVEIMERMEESNRNADKRFKIQLVLFFVLIAFGIFFIFR